MRTSTSYVIAGPRTLRLASRQILKKQIIFNGKRQRRGWGGNLQNIEKSIREVYEADGYCAELEEKCKHYLLTGDWSVFTEEELAVLRILIQVDQSGAEALVVAYCCENGSYRQLFINGIKPHVYLAIYLFKDIWPRKMREHNLITADSGFDIDEIVNTPIPLLRQHPFWNSLDRLIKDSDNWSLDQRYYFLAKQTEHSSNYDVQPPMFRMNTLEKSGGKIVISKEDSERFLMTKFSLFPEIKGYHRWVLQCAESNRILYNLHGHPYQLTHYELLPSQKKELYAWVPQSVVGEITNIAYTNMQEYIENTGKQWDLLANTHDSYLLQCPIPQAVECAKKAKEFMGQEFVSPIDGVKFKMRSEAVQGFNWSPYKKEKNELGLREISTP